MYISRLLSILVSLGLSVEALPSTANSRHLRPVLSRRQTSNQAGFSQGQPIDGKGKGAPLSGGTNHYLDVQNPANLGQESTDSGVVVNLKWSFSNSKTRLLNGGWVREQTITDLPASHDFTGAQLHLTKGSIRELHWHRVNEWGYVYKGQMAISAVDENGRNSYDVLNEGDVWYFPKGAAHAIQGVAEQNEALFMFDDGGFDALGTTFMVDDWITHTPKDILAQNFGVDPSVFGSVPSPNPYISNGTVANDTIESPYGKLEGNSSYVYRASRVAATKTPGGGGTVKIIDSRSFPAAKSIAASLVVLQPGALRELHWHPNAEEWLYFLQGNARSTVFMGGATARTFDFTAGDTAVFPDNSGHYIQNTSKNETLMWLELYKSDRVVDISLSQWLALTPSSIVSQVLKVPVDVVKKIKKEKQIIVA